MNEMALLEFGRFKWVLGHYFLWIGRKIAKGMVGVLNDTTFISFMIRHLFLLHSLRPSHQGWRPAPLDSANASNPPVPQ